MRKRTGTRVLGTSFLVIFVSLWLAAAPALGSGAWEDSNGRFSIDLPKKWALETQETITEPDEIRAQVLENEPDADLSAYSDEDLSAVKYKFSNKKEKVAVYMVFSPAVSEMTAREMFEDVVESLPESGLTDVAPEGEVADLEVNGHAARWGVYKGMIEGTAIPLYSFVGAVNLDKGTVNFLMMVSEGKKKKLADTIETMFRSIR